MKRQSLSTEMKATAYFQVVTYYALKIGSKAAHGRWMKWSRAILHLKLL